MAKKSFKGHVVQGFFVGGPQDYRGSCDPPQSTWPQARRSIFPNAESCWRLVTALAAEQHEEWQEGSRYMDMGLPRDHRKERMRHIETKAA